MESITSLEFLKDFTEGDEERINKYVGMYLSSAEENAKEFKKLMDEQRLDELRSIVHSMKPHFDFMGMKTARALAETIEASIIENTSIESLPEKVSELIAMIEQSLVELRH